MKTEKYRLLKVFDDKIIPYDLRKKFFEHFEVDNKFIEKIIEWKISNNTNDFSFKKEIDNWLINNDASQNESVVIKLTIPPKTRIYHNNDSWYTYYATGQQYNNK